MSVMSDSVWPHRQQPTRLLSLGFSRQEHWSGLPFPSPVRESEVTQSCPTLRDPINCSLTRLLHPWNSPGKSTEVGCHCLLCCDPMDCSPADSSIHGISQARALKWGAIAFSIVTPWTSAYQGPPSMGFPRQEDWSRCHCLLWKRV